MTGATAPGIDGGGVRFRRLISEPSRRAGAIAIHSGSAPNRCGAVPAPPARRTWPSFGQWQPEGSSHCPHPEAGASLNSRSPVRRAEILAPQLCASQRLQRPAARPCVAPICRASGCKRLRSPQRALRARPAPPRARPPEAPADTRPSPTLRPAPAAAAPTRAREAPTQILQTRGVRRPHWTGPCSPGTLDWRRVSLAARSTAASV